MVWHEKLSDPRTTRTTYPEGAEMKKRAGDFLTQKFHATGFSRKEAADRAGITEGYLSGLLAGRIIQPSPEIIERMARHWGFNELEYFLAVGLINRSDIEAYMAKEELTPDHYPEEVQTLVGRLMAIPADKRKQIVMSIGDLLTNFGDAWPV